MNYLENIKLAKENKKEISLPFSKGLPPDFDLQALAPFVPASALENIRLAAENRRDINLPFNKPMPELPAAEEPETTISLDDPQSDRIRELQESLIKRPEDQLGDQIINKTPEIIGRQISDKYMNRIDPTRIVPPVDITGQALEQLDMAKMPQTIERIGRGGRIEEFAPELTEKARKEAEKSKKESLFSKKPSTMDYVDAFAKQAETDIVNLGTAGAGLLASSFHTLFNPVMPAKQKQDLWRLTFDAMGKAQEEGSFENLSNAIALALVVHGGIEGLRKIPEWYRWEKYNYDLARKAAKVTERGIEVAMPRTSEIQGIIEAQNHNYRLMNDQQLLDFYKKSPNVIKAQMARANPRMQNILKELNITSPEISKAGNVVTPATATTPTTTINPPAKVAQPPAKIPEPAPVAKVPTVKPVPVAHKPPETAKIPPKTPPQVKEPVKAEKAAEIEKKEDALIQEAKKYKSADEFVRAQGKEIYHATDSEPFDVFDISKAKKGETYFNPLGTGQYLSSNKEFVRKFGTNTMEYVLPKNAKTKIVTINNWAKKDYPIIIKNTLKKLGIKYDNLSLDEKVMLARQVPDTPIMSLNNAEVIIGDIAERFGKKGDIQKLMEQVSDSRNASYDAIIFRDTDSPFNADEILIPKPSIIKTKSQLTDIWNKAQEPTRAKPAPLTAEQAVKQGMSAEEFVKKQDIVYHSGSFVEEDDKIFIIEDDGGIHFGTKDAAMARISGKAVEEAISAVDIYQAEDGTWSIEIDGAIYGEGYPSKQEAAIQARNIADSTEAPEESYDEKYITGAKLLIKNPKKVPDQGTDWKPAIKQAKQEGYDSIIYVNEFEDEGSLSYIVFSPDQIKTKSQLLAEYEKAKAAQVKGTVQEPEAKEPWQMTKRVFVEDYQKKETGRTLWKGRDFTETTAKIEARKLGKEWSIEKSPYEKNRFVVVRYKAKISPDEYLKEYGDEIAITHKQIIKKAISEGKSVPTEVLKDYPELQKPAAKAKKPSPKPEKRPPISDRKTKGMVNVNAFKKWSGAHRKLFNPVQRAIGMRDSKRWEHIVQQRIISRDMITNGVETNEDQIAIFNFIDNQQKYPYKTLPENLKNPKVLRSINNSRRQTEALRSQAQRNNILGKNYIDDDQYIMTMLENEDGSLPTKEQIYSINRHTTKPLRERMFELSYKPDPRKPRKYMTADDRDAVLKRIMKDAGLPALRTNRRFLEVYEKYVNSLTHKLANREFTNSLRESAKNELDGVREWYDPKEYKEFLDNLKTKTKQKVQEIVKQGKQAKGYAKFVKKLDEEELGFDLAELIEEIEPPIGTDIVKFDDIFDIQQKEIEAQMSLFETEIPTYLIKEYGNNTAIQKINATIRYEVRKIRDAAIEEHTKRKNKYLLKYIDLAEKQGYVIPNIKQDKYGRMTSQIAGLVFTPQQAKSLEKVLEKLNPSSIEDLIRGWKLTVACFDLFQFPEMLRQVAATGGIKTPELFKKIVGMSENELYEIGIMSTKYGLNLKMPEDIDLKIFGNITAEIDKAISDNKSSIMKLYEKVSEDIDKHPKIQKIIRGITKPIVSLEKAQWVWALPRVKAIMWKNFTRVLLKNGWDTEQARFGAATLTNELFQGLNWDMLMSEDTPIGRAMTKSRHRLLNIAFFGSDRLTSVLLRYSGVAGGSYQAFLFRWVLQTIGIGLAITEFLSYAINGRSTLTNKYGRIWEVETPLKDKKGRPVCFNLIGTWAEPLRLIDMPARFVINKFGLAPRVLGIGQKDYYKPESFRELLWEYRPIPFSVRNFIDAAIEKEDKVSLKTAGIQSAAEFMGIQSVIRSKDTKAARVSDLKVFGGEASFYQYLLSRDIPRKKSDTEKPKKRPRMKW